MVIDIWLTNFKTFKFLDVYKVKKKYLNLIVNLWNRLYYAFWKYCKISFEVPNEKLTENWVINLFLPNISIY
jgi:hypothetical protein